MVIPVLFSVDALCVDALCGVTYTCSRVLFRESAMS